MWSSSSSFVGRSGRSMAFRKLTTSRSFQFSSTGRGISENRDPLGIDSADQQSEAKRKSQERLYGAGKMGVNQKRHFDPNDPIHYPSGSNDPDYLNLPKRFVTMKGGDSCRCKVRRPTRNESPSLRPRARFLTTSRRQTDMIVCQETKRISLHFVVQAYGEI